MEGRKLTIEQKDAIQGVFFTNNTFFNCIQDINDEWFLFLSEQEYYHCLGLWYLDELNAELIFIKDLSLSLYEPKIVENPFV